MGGVIQRILVGTDFSASARMAVDRAARIAAQHAAELTVAHVLCPLPKAQRDQLGPDFGAKWPAHFAKALSDERARLSDRASLRVETRLLEGLSHRELDALARDLRASLVVVGSAGHGGWRDVLLGSTSDRLLRLLPCPALVVRQVAGRNYAKVASCTDFSDQAEAALHCALRLAPEATHLVLHVLQNELDASLAYSLLAVDEREAVRRAASQQAMGALVALLDSLDDTAAQIVPALREGHPSRILDDVVSEFGLDLVAVGAQGHSRMGHGFLGSVSRHAAASLTCDVLLVPAAG